MTGLVIRVDRFNQVQILSHILFRRDAVASDPKPDGTYVVTSIPTEGDTR